MGDLCENLFRENSHKNLQIWEGFSARRLSIFIDRRYSLKLTAESYRYFLQRCIELCRLGMDENICMRGCFVQRIGKFLKLFD